MQHIHKKMKKLLWILFAMILLAAGGTFYLRIQSKPVLIGVSAQLTGRQAELGVQVRNGIQLAADKINGSGGIHGKAIQLIIRDDYGIPEKAEEADEELIRSGVVAIIGHVTTAQTFAGLKVTNPAKIVMIGPNISTPELSGLDDYFFRIYPSFKKSAEAYAQYMHDQKHVNKIAILYDKDNRGYTETYRAMFAEKTNSLGMDISDEISFSSVSQPDFYPLIQKLHAKAPEGILVIASDVDTALIAQRIRLMGWDIPIFTTAWAQTETLIKNGGKAVEGMILEQSYALYSQSKKFMSFEDAYRNRFGSRPSFGAAYGYEALMVLAAALEKTDSKAAGLKNALIGIHNFPGLIDTFSMDPFGDVVRPFYISTIRNGKFVVLERLT